MALLQPADRALGPIAAFEADMDALADPGLDVAFDHHPVSGDVGDMDFVALASEDDLGPVGNIDEPSLAALVGRARFLATNGDAGEAARTGLVGAVGSLADDDLARAAFLHE